MNKNSKVKSSRKGSAHQPKFLTLLPLSLKGNLNPDFPFGDVFRFKITMEQLNFTQVRLAVYDDDPDDEDDFMGVAFIDLSKVGDFFDNIITEWYSLIPQVNNTWKINTTAWESRYIRLKKRHLTLVEFQISNYISLRSRILSKIFR